jgi:hypothetical protein
MLSGSAILQSSTVSTLNSVRLGYDLSRTVVPRRMDEATNFWLGISSTSCGRTVSIVFSRQGGLTLFVYTT